MQKKIVLLLLTLVISITGCVPESEKKEIMISAASSMTEPLDEIISEFEKINPEYDLIVNYGSSGSLSKQILEGAPIDIFISASLDKFNPLLEKEIIKDNHSIFLSNTLVLITHSEFNTSSLKDNEYDDFTKFKYSIGDPKTVPAGKYAHETMTSLGIYNADNSNMILAKSVKQVLQYVETQNVDFGIVYKTDIYDKNNIRILKEYSSDLHEEISYCIGIIDDSTSEDTLKVYDFILSKDSISIFNKYGFKTDL